MNHARDNDETARARARLSQLVLHFDVDLWNAILAWPVPLHLANEKRISERVSDDPVSDDTAYNECVDASAEVVRVCKLVQVCKTFYNRYRKRNQDNWVERGILFCNWTSKKNHMTWRREPHELGAVDTRGYPDNRFVGTAKDRYARVSDEVTVSLRNIRIESDRMRMVHARAFQADEEERVRHVMYRQREVVIGFDIVVDKDALMATSVSDRNDPLKRRNGLTHPTCIKHHVSPPRKGGRTQLSDADVLIRGGARAGYSWDRRPVAGLPMGPEQYTTLIFVSNQIDLVVVYKITGGAFKLNGFFNNSTFGLCDTEQHADWLAKLDAGERIPTAYRTGVVHWKSASYIAGCVRPPMQNVRVFLPPSTVVRSSEGAAPCKQGRPPIPDLDAVSDDEL